MVRVSTKPMSNTQLEQAIKANKLYFLGACSLVSVIFATQPVGALSLNLLPALQSVSVGDAVAVKVEISDLGNFQAPSLSGFDLDVSFDPSVLIFNTVTFGDPTLGDLVNLSNTTGLTSVTPSLGMVNFAEVSLDSDTALNAAQPSSFILATLNFKALTAAINSPINLSVKDLSDENTNSLTVAGTPGGASVTVTSSPVKIPEPSFSPLVLGLTVGLGFCLTWKKTSR